jgi:hypothetical protein
VEYVARSLGTALDFRWETLPILDHYVRQAQATLPGRPDLLDLLARATGAYFGEVARHAIDGFWLLGSNNLHDWRLCARPVYLHFNPFGVAYDALCGNSEHGGPRSNLDLLFEDRATVEARLSALPPVPEDEYYAFSTRLEVLGVAVDAVHGLMQERGYGETTYDERDYAAGYTL